MAQVRHQHQTQSAEEAEKEGFTVCISSFRLPLLSVGSLLDYCGKFKVHIYMSPWEWIIMTIIFPLISSPPQPIPDKGLLEAQKLGFCRTKSTGYEIILGSLIGIFVWEGDLTRFIKV